MAEALGATFTPLSPAIGAEVTGLSGNQLVDQRVADLCLVALEDRGVVVFRAANLDDGQLVALTRMLGEVVVAPRGGEVEHPEVSAITLDPAKSRLAEYRKGTFFWHIDGVNDELPQKATLLTALEVAEEGGDTEFANTFAAYEALGPEEKAELEGVQVRHTLAASQRLVYPDPTPEQEAGWAKAPARVHPLVWTRPGGRRSLLVGATTDEVVGLPADESRLLLDRLQAWCTEPQFVLRHRWQKGDLVLWDNTGLLHRALPYEPTSRRLLHRTTLVGEHAVA